MDTGTFLLSDGGTEIAVDSGTCSYGRPEYRGYYSTPQAHNVVLYNGLGPDPDMIDSGTKFPGTFPAFIESDDHSFTYLLADCTGPYTRCFSRFYRHLVFLQDWILFVDDIQAYEPGSLEWRMHYSGHLITENDQTLLRNSGCETPFYPLYPIDQKLSTGIGYRDGEMLSMRGMRDPERQRKQQEALPTGHFLTLTSTMKGRRAKLVQAIGRPHSSDCRTAPSVKTFDGGLRITFHGSSFTEEVLINTRADGSYMHRNSWLTVDGLETDAFLVYTKRRTSSSLCDVALVNGSCLKLDDAFRLGCLMKIDGHFDLERKQGIVCSGMDQPLTLSAPLPASVSLQEGRHSLHWSLS